MQEAWEYLRFLNLNICIKVSFTALKAAFKGAIEFQLSCFASELKWRLHAEPTR
jgi:hypothetical protein